VTARGHYLDKRLDRTREFPITLHLSETLVDASATCKTVGDLTGRLNIIDLLDLCTLVEAVVLHDRILMIGAIPHDRFHELLRPLFDSGVLVQDNSRTRIADLGPEPGNRDLKDAWYETGRLVGAERQSGITASPMLRQATYSTKQGRVPEHHAVCNLTGHYSQLSEALQQLRSSARLQPQDYISLPIPPIALEVLRMSNSATEFLERSLDVRERFESLRVRLAHLRVILGDSDVTPKKKLQHISRWADSWATLDRYGEPSQVLKLAHTSIGLLDQKLASTGEWQGSARLTDIAANMLRIGAEALSKWRVRILHQTAKKYLQTSDQSLLSETERIFSRSVSEHELKVAHTLLIEPNTSAPLQ